VATDFAPHGEEHIRKLLARWQHQMTMALGNFGE
jgi:hypothetical protein